MLRDTSHPLYFDVAVVSVFARLMRGASAAFASDTKYPRAVEDTTDTRLVVALQRTMRVCISHGLLPRVVLVLSFVSSLRGWEIKKPATNSGRGLVLFGFSPLYQ